MDTKGIRLDASDILLQSVASRRKHCNLFSLIARILLRGKEKKRIDMAEGAMRCNLNPGQRCGPIREVTDGEKGIRFGTRDSFFTRAGISIELGHTGVPIVLIFGVSENEPQREKADEWRR